MADVDWYTRTNPDGTVYHFRDDRLPGGVTCIFPVGYIYMSVDSTDPGDFFGGTWERIQDAFLLAAGTNHSAGSTGGAETVTLTASQMPAHTHGSKSLSGTFGIRHSTNGGSVANGTGIVTINQSTASNYTRFQGESTSVAGDKITVNATHEHTSVGGGGAHDNMPPYLAVYMWKRTA